MNGPRLRPSGNSLRPYLSSRRETSSVSSPDRELLCSRCSTSSAAIACHGVWSLETASIAVVEAIVLAPLDVLYDLDDENRAAVYEMPGYCGPIGICVFWNTTTKGLGLVVLQRNE